MSDYDYHLPPRQIAQAPAPRRDASRLMVLEREGDITRHLHFRDVPTLLRDGDLLVLNDTRVFPARLEGKKASGGGLEFLFLERHGEVGCWTALCRGGRHLKPGSEIDFGDGVTGEVKGWHEGKVVLAFPPSTDLDVVLDARGAVPLPPYIRREPHDPRRREDIRRYQTVFSRHRGAVAAPTAGLHFTTELLEELQEIGVGVSFLTLHVGPGTFMPVREKNARCHRLPAERFLLPGSTAASVAATRRQGKRVVAVGTTVARVLEHVARRGEMRESAGECDLYVLPGHRFRAVDALITNFHLPRSTLLLFVAAFAGRERILRAYRAALERNYRFYSYGDAMMIF